MTDDIKDDEDFEKPDKSKRLGRGLSALFEDDEDFGEDNNTEESSLISKSPQRLGLDQLRPGKFQPRRDIDQDAIKELAESISIHGVLQPLLVRPLDGEHEQYEIIAGERRWRAAQIVQLHDVPVLIKDLNDQDTLEIALIENLQREDLNPLEEALGYQQLMQEFGHTQEKVAASMGKSRSHVANMVRLLNLPATVQSYIRSGDLSMGHARTLVTADDPEFLAKQIISKKLSVREAEKLASQKPSNDDKAGKKKAAKTQDAQSEKGVDTIALEDELSGMLGVNVSIDMKPTGKNPQAGTLTLGYTTLDQLDEILHRLSHYPGRRQTG